MPPRLVHLHIGVDISTVQGMYPQVFGSDLLDDVVSQTLPLGFLMIQRTHVWYEQEENPLILSIKSSSIIPVVALVQQALITPHSHAHSP